MGVFSYDIPAPGVEHGHEPVGGPGRNAEAYDEPRDGRTARVVRTVDTARRARTLDAGVVRG
ncbi:hypothetical protein G3I28_27650, partial [Streptomyces sp. SID10116]|nr:hypothetical protein [Streptomyces sp. SID10116]